MVLFRSTQVQGECLVPAECYSVNHWNIALIHNVAPPRQAEVAPSLSGVRVRMQPLASLEAFVLLPGCDLA